jgi:EAL domain-containing protein (putative c-di-GMP-specific phosphodiesterase class I)
MICDAVPASLSFDLERFKMDRSLIRRLLCDASDEGIACAIIQMAHRLKIGVMPEGIEDAATLQRLVGLGCGFGQGFHRAPGLAADEFAAFVARSRAGARQA